jgi:RNA polymerase sigma-70 factor (ECF subfamily)
MNPDQDLVEAVQRGHTNAFSELVHRHQQAMLRVALRLTRDMEMAEDIVQESFLKAYQKIEMFEGRSSFKSWLYRITMNTAKNRLRSKPKENVNLDDLQMAVDGHVDSNLADGDVRSQLQVEIEKLPQRQKLALTLRIFDDLSFKEIADVMECPYDTAKANYRHAILKLKERFENDLDLRAWTYESETHVRFLSHSMEVDG